MVLRKIKNYTSQLNYAIPLPIYTGHGRHVILAADPFTQKSIPDLPREHRRVFSLIRRYGVHNRGGGDLWLGATDHTGLEAACLVVPEEESWT